MPRVVAAMLCGTLIWVYPKLLEIVLAHAERTERYALAYSTLAGVTAMLTGLVGFYMWLGFKSGPSGLEHTLRGFAASLGKDSEVVNSAKTTSAADRQTRTDVRRSGAAFLCRLGLRNGEEGGSGGGE